MIALQGQFRSLHGDVSLQVRITYVLRPCSYQSHRGSARTLLATAAARSPILIVDAALALRAFGGPHAMAKGSELAHLTAW